MDFTVSVAALLELCIFVTSQCVDIHPVSLQLVSSVIIYCALTGGIQKGLATPDIYTHC